MVYENRPNPTDPTKMYEDQLGLKNRSAGPKPEDHYRDGSAAAILALMASPSLAKRIQTPNLSTSQGHQQQPKTSPHSRASSFQTLLPRRPHRPVVKETRGARTPGEGVMPEEPTAGQETKGDTPSSTPHAPQDAAEECEDDSESQRPKVGPGMMVVDCYGSLTKSEDWYKPLDTQAVAVIDLKPAVVWSFSQTTETWTQNSALVYFPGGKDLHGGIRVAQKMIFIDDPSSNITKLWDEIQTWPNRAAAAKYVYGDTCALYVAKGYKKRQDPKVHFDELLTQAVADAYAQKFNRTQIEFKVSKALHQIGILPVRVLKIIETNQFYNIEPFLPGKYQKFNDNFKYVHPATHFNKEDGIAQGLTKKQIKRKMRSKRFSRLAQAYSHFTYVHSRGQCIVVDIQGVGAYYTDAQIHTRNGKGFGLGNLGAPGLVAFVGSHACTRVCRALGLRRFAPKDRARAEQMSEMQRKQKLMHRERRRKQQEQLAVVDRAVAVLEQQAPKFLDLELKSYEREQPFMSREKQEEIYTMPHFQLDPRSKPPAPSPALPLEPDPETAHVAQQVHKIMIAQTLKLTKKYDLQWSKP